MNRVMICEKCRQPMKYEGASIIDLRPAGRQAYQLPLYTCETPGCELRGRTYSGDKELLPDDFDRGDSQEVDG